MLANEQENGARAAEYGRYGQGMRGKLGAGLGRGFGPGRAQQMEEEDQGHVPGNNGRNGHGPDAGRAQGHHGNGAVVHYHYHYHYSCPAPHDATMPEGQREAETVRESTEEQN